MWFLNANASTEVAHDVIAREEGLAGGKEELDLPWSVDGIVQDLGYAKAHQRSEDLAGGLSSGLRRARPKARFRGIRQARFGVLKEAQMPAVVLEIGYLTHPEEGLDLLREDTQFAFAHGVLWGLVAYDRALALAARGKARSGQRPAAWTGAGHAGPDKAAARTDGTTTTQPGGPTNATPPAH